MLLFPVYSRQKKAQRSLTSCNAEKHNCNNWQEWQLNRLSVGSNVLHLFPLLCCLLSFLLRHYKKTWKLEGIIYYNCNTSTEIAVYVLHIILSSPLADFLSSISQYTHNFFTCYFSPSEVLFHCMFVARHATIIAIFLFLWVTQRTHGLSNKNLGELFISLFLDLIWKVVLFLF